MTTSVVTLHSKLDPSVNTYMNGFETRFVVRDDSLIIYLSSFKGCDQACRMCHLTQTGQTDMTPATLEDFIKQAEVSLGYALDYADRTGINIPAFVHFNFMARGEPLLNDTVMSDWDNLSEGLEQQALSLFPGTTVKFKISTIMTGIYKYNSDGMIIDGYNELPFYVRKPEIYYSLYSVNPEFRKRWLPKAQDYTEMLRILSTYARKGGEVRIHSAFIQGHNNDLVDVGEMIKAIKYWGLPLKYNIVRFNSPDIEKYEEATMEELEDIKSFMESKGFTVQMVPRVGEDNYGSCGMFMSEKDFH